MIRDKASLDSEELERALRQSQDRFRKIFEHSNDAILISDPADNFKILEANTKASAILGFSKEELLSKRIADLHPNEMKKLAAFAKSVEQAGQGWTDELSCRAKDGDCVPTEISASFIELDGKRCMIGLIRDISKRKAAERALRKANEELEQRVATRTVELSQANASLEKALAEVGELKNRLQVENVYLQEEIKLEHNFDEIITNSPVVKKLLNNVEQGAKTEATVLILGETGTGKELIARAVHCVSPRKGRPLVKVNCAALPANLIESELFGHEKGAFTGALVRKQGRFEIADQGTLFLDEIGDLPVELQAKLLRVLQEGEFERLGSTKTQRVDVRIIAATNRDLKKAVEAGRFREDLFYRLNVFPLSLPPLRDRREDIPLLLKHFANKFATKLGKQIDAIPQKTLQQLQSYSWPGNVRELENLVERSVILAKGNRLVFAESTDLVRTTAEFSADAATLAEVERRHILATLEQTNWRIEGPQGAAIRLGLHANTLRSRMNKLAIKKKTVAG